ncbi:MAG: hypothetical protein K2J12_02075 [Muribaculaceae bacterium]|nr:hypothetical protein [Muribaculaceae bacterium]
MWGGVVDIPLKYKSEFISNSNWLKIGFHSDSPVFNNKITKHEFRTSINEVNNAINRFADTSVIAKTLRLHYYFCPDSLIHCLENVTTLLCADSKNRISYNLTIEEANYIFNNNQIIKDNLKYIKTNIRLENHINIGKELRKLQDQDTLVIFTHEWALIPQTPRQILSILLHEHRFQCNTVVKNNLEKTLQWLNEHEYKYSFL